MHGNRHPWLQLIHQGPGLLGVNGVEAAHRDHQGVQPLQSLQLLRLQLTAQVPQVGHPQALRLDDMDGIGPSLSALLIIVPGMDRLHRHIGLLSGEGHQLPRSVVPVVVAAVHRVRPQADGGQPRHRAVQIGVDHHSASGSLQGKAGMSVPDQAHKIPSFLCQLADSSGMSTWQSSRKLPALCRPKPVSRGNPGRFLGELSQLYHSGGGMGIFFPADPAQAALEPAFFTPGIVF